MVRYILLSLLLTLHVLVNAQNPNNSYVIRGVAVTGLKLHAIDITLLSNEGRKIAKTRSSNFGDFQFRGLSNGKYRIINKQYKLDTSFVINNKSIYGLLIELDICDVSEETARNDVKNHIPKLLLVGGIAPVYYKDQGLFEKKYKIGYVEYGCTPPSMKCVIAYNREIFKYLDKKYSRVWREEVRQDVVGL